MQGKGAVCHFNVDLKRRWFQFLIGAAFWRGIFCYFSFFQARAWDPCLFDSLALPGSVAIIFLLQLELQHNRPNLQSEYLPTGTGNPDSRTPCPATSPGEKSSNYESTCRDILPPKGNEIYTRSWKEPSWNPGFILC